MAANYAKLKAWLAQSKWQTEKPAGYQTIYALIEGLQAAVDSIDNINVNVSDITGGITELTGDVSAGPGSGSQVAVIPADTITYAKMQNVSAASRLIGRGSASGAGNPEELTVGTGLTISGTVLSNTVIAIDDPIPSVLMLMGA